MGNFCTRCGRALQEGEVCSCQLQGKKIENQQTLSGQTSSPKQVEANLEGLGGQAPQPSQLGQQASSLAQNFIKEILKIIKKPVTVGKDMIMKADVKTALLLIAFQGIFSAIFTIVQEGRITSEFDISTPYIRVFIVTWLLSVGLACVLALLLKLGNALIKIPVSYHQMLSVVAIRSAVLVPAIIFALIVAGIHIGVGFALFILINIWGFSAMIVSVSLLIEQNKLNKFVLMVSIIILMFILLSVFVLSKIWMYYLPDEVRTLISNLNDIENLLSYFL